MGGWGVVIYLRVTLLIAVREQALTMWAAYGRSRAVFRRSPAQCVCIEGSAKLPFSMRLRVIGNTTTLTIKFITHTADPKSRYGETSVGHSKCY